LKSRFSRFKTLSTLTGCGYGNFHWSLQSSASDSDCSWCPLIAARQWLYEQQLAQAARLLATIM